MSDRRSQPLEEYQRASHADPPARHTDHSNGTHLPYAAVKPPAADTGQGAERVNGADRTATHPYPEVPPQRPGRPAGSSDLPPGHDHEEPTGGASSGHDDRQAAQAQGHPAGAKVIGETSGTGNDGVSARDPQSTATGQETPASGQGDNLGEAVESDDATKLPEASSGKGEPQDSVVEDDATEALKRRIAELEAESAAKDTVIAEQQDAIEAKDAALAEKDSTIAGQWRKISELDYRAEDLKDENDRLKNEKAEPGTGDASPEHDADVPGTSQEQDTLRDQRKGTGQVSDTKVAKTSLRKMRDAVDKVASSDNLSIAKSAVTGGVSVGAATQNPTWGAVGAVVAGVLDFWGQVRKKNENK